MKSDPGWTARAAILRQAVESKLLVPLREHGWTTTVDRLDPAEGGYSVVSAERNGLKRSAALLYSSATDNSLYRRLEAEVDLILFNGQPYMVAQFTQGITKPVLSADDFPVQLMEWNRTSVPDKIGPPNLHTDFVEEQPSAQRVRRLTSETPIESIWSRLSRLKSAKLAEKAVAYRADSSGIALTRETLKSKGSGIAYAIRNASDYFSPKLDGNLSQRVLNLYYGCLSFAFAEQLAASDGPTELSQVEESTKQGHGLWLCDGAGEDFGSLAIGPLRSGFFPGWIKSQGVGPLATVDKKPRRASDLAAVPPDSWATMEQLFGRIPEVGDLFEDIFSGPPGWVAPTYDVSANQSRGLFGTAQRPETTYVILTDNTGRVETDALRNLPDNVREIALLSSNGRARRYRAAVDHPGAPTAWDALGAHRSPYIDAALILPVFGATIPFRSLCFAILYGLSILVRYRPGLWRRVQEGDLDEVHALIEAFLPSVERIIPQHFLESITGERISVHQPGSLLG